MKIIKINVLILCMASFFACEKENSDNPSNENATVENQKIDSIIELARNFDKQLPAETLEKNAKAYFQLSHEEMAIFIDERHKISLEKGATVQNANTNRELMHSINDYLYEAYSQSYASADPDAFRDAYQRITLHTRNVSTKSEDEKYWWGCNNWKNSSLTPISRVYNDNQRIVTLKGEYKLKGGEDCQYIYESVPYGNRFRSRYIYAQTPQSWVAMRYLESYQKLSKEESVNDIYGLKSLEFMIEKWRINQAYGPDVNGKKRFAEDVKIILN